MQALTKSIFTATLVILIAIAVSAPAFAQIGYFVTNGNSLQKYNLDTQELTPPLDLGFVFLSRTDRLVILNSVTGAVTTVGD